MPLAITYLQMLSLACKHFRESCWHVLFLDAEIHTSAFLLTLISCNLSTHEMSEGIRVWSPGFRLV